MSVKFKTKESKMKAGRLAKASLGFWACVGVLGVAHADAMVALGAALQTVTQGHIATAEAAMAVSQELSAGQWIALSVVAVGMTAGVIGLMAWDERQGKIAQEKSAKKLKM